MKVKVRGNGLTVPAVPCQVFLPERAEGRVALRFQPNKRQVDLLPLIFECSIEGATMDLAGTRTEIRATKVYLHAITTKRSGKKAVEYSAEAEPVDLKVVAAFRSRIENLKGKTSGVFWLTPSLLLTPAKTIEHSYSGNVRVQTVHQLRFPLRGGPEMVFDTHFKHTRNEAGEVITFSELVAELEVPVERRGLRAIEGPILNALDDFLLITSFAERWRCACVGWVATNSRNVTTLYRRDISIPEHSKEHTLNDTLIDIADFLEFANVAYASVVAGSNPLLRQAVQYAVYRRDRTLEHSFLTLFEALETLLLHFRRLRGLEFILEENRWEAVSKSIKSAIKAHPDLVQDKDARKLLYEKLPELNRVSFGTVFQRFCETYGVDLRDLWPVVGDSSGISLSDIRNKLVHGEHFPQAHLVPLIMAENHLRWVVERVILGFLGWPVDRSQVSSSSLTGMNSYLHWHESRRILSL